jgi:hypothetical protein
VSAASGFTGFLRWVRSTHYFGVCCNIIHADTICLRTLYQSFSLVRRNWILLPNDIEEVEAFYVCQSVPMPCQTLEGIKKLVCDMRFVCARKNAVEVDASWAGGGDKRGLLRQIDIPCSCLVSCK